MVVLPRGESHVLSDRPGSATKEILELLSKRRPTDAGPLAHGGGGARATLLCGRFEVDGSQTHPLLSMLPPVLILRGEGGQAGPWLEATLDLLAQESAALRTGSEAVLARITDILFVQTIRAFLDSSEPKTSGWLRGLTDAQIAAALAAIHREPERDWTVDELASVAAMSRSTFCERFRSLVGEPPGKYLTRWRMHLAAAALRDGADSLKELAKRVGYQDEGALSKAFRRRFGVSPGRYRRAPAQVKSPSPDARRSG